MAKKSTFALNLPSASTVESYKVELANGQTVTRTAAELQRHPLAHSDVTTGASR